MNSKSDDQLDSLFRAARAAKPDTSPLEYGFETRLLARLRAERQRGAPWWVWSWRLVPVFASVVIGLGVWSFAGNGSSPADLHAAIAGNTDEEWMVSYLTGE